MRQFLSLTLVITLSLMVSSCGNSLTTTGVTMSRDLSTNDAVYICSDKVIKIRGVGTGEQVVRNMEALEATADARSCPSSNFAELDLGFVDEALCGIRSGSSSDDERCSENEGHIYVFAQIKSGTGRLEITHSLKKSGATSGNTTIDAQSVATSGNMTIDAQCPGGGVLCEGETTGARVGKDNLMVISAIGKNVAGQPWMLNSLYLCLDRLNSSCSGSNKVDLYRDGARTIGNSYVVALGIRDPLVLAKLKFGLRGLSIHATFSREGHEACDPALVATC